MNYISLINKYWQLQHRFELGANETHLYMMLLDSCNKLSWQNGFGHSNTYICALLHISNRNLMRTRKKLIDLGLIKFESGKTNREQSTYFIIDTSNEFVDVNLIKKNSPNSENEHHNNKTKTKTKTKTIKRSIEKDSDKELFENDLNEDEELLAFGNEAVLKIFNNYNLKCVKQPKVKLLSDERKKMINYCIKSYGFENVDKMLDKVADSDWLAGKNRFNWIACFNWIFTPKNFIRIIEGEFDNKPGNITLYQPGRRPSPLEELSTAYNEILDKEEDFFNELY